MKSRQSPTKVVARGSILGKPRGPNVGFFTLLVLGWSMDSPRFLENPPLTCHELCCCVNVSTGYCCNTQNSKPRQGRLSLSEHCNQLKLWLTAGSKFVVFVMTVLSVDLFGLSYVYITLCVKSQGFTLLKCNEVYTLFEYSVRVYK